MLDNCCSCRLKVKISSCLLTWGLVLLLRRERRERGAAGLHDQRLLQSPRDTQTRAPPGHQARLHSLSVSQAQRATICHDVRGGHLVTGHWSGHLVWSYLNLSSLASKVS